MNIWSVWCHPSPIKYPTTYNNTWSQAHDHGGNVPGSLSHIRKKIVSSTYMKEFISRVDAIIEVMDDAEALPEPSQCANCNGSAGQWLCNNCIGHHILCQKCMRDSHFSNPLHWIGCWTGIHFHLAALWEVGVYLILPHRTMPYLQIGKLHCICWDVLMNRYSVAV